MAAQRITATYRIETAYPIREAVETMAGEQSTGTFVRLPGETDELRELYGAHIERITELDEVAEPSLPGAGVPKGGLGKPVWRRAEVVLSWSLDNFGASLPNLVATVAGNLFELRPFSGLRLLDMTLPEEFAAKYPGPKFGVAGTRGSPAWRDGR
jgi:ribulose-bisphosphate carboxylase large chain